MIHSDHNVNHNYSGDGMTHEILDINVMPLTRIIPKIKFPGIQEKIKMLSHEVWLSELMTVSKGDRKCATYHIRSDQLLQDTQLLTDLGLHFEPLQKVKRVSGFAHTFYKPEPNEPYDVYGVITKEKKYALKWKEAHLANPTDHITMAELLAYPENDSKFFNEVWGKKSLDPVWEAALNSEHTRVDKYTIEMPNKVPESNMLPRYFGIRAVPQIVCSFDNEANVEYAKMFLKYIPHADLVMEMLRKSYTWDCYRGIAMLYTDEFIGVCNSVTFKHKHIVKIGEAE